MATSSQKKFISTVAPSITKYVKKYGFKIASFIIAQACLESGYGTSNAATTKKNIFGIGPGMVFASWDACCEAYFTKTVLGKSQAAKNAKTLDEYYKAFVASGYLGGNNQAGYYNNLKSIIQTYNLQQYDNGKVASTYADNKCEEFVQKALSYKGTVGLQWGAKHPGFAHYSSGWCADFVSAVANEVGIGSGSRGSSKSKIIIANHCGAHKLVELTHKNYKGVIHYSTSNNYGYKPQRGDIINFRNAVYRASGLQYSTHVGIVVKYKDGVIHTVEGNVGNSNGRLSKVVTRTFKRKDPYVYRFCTPVWEKVGGFPIDDASDGSVSTYSSSGSYGISGDLFADLNTREDAVAREVCYLQTKYKKGKENSNVISDIEKYLAVVPSDSIRLSIVNYSELFQAFWEAGASSISASSSSSITGNYDYSKLDSKVRTVITYLTKKGLNNAAACGIAGNIKAESSFRTEAVGDGGTSFGICQWHEGRGAAMKKMAGANWANNLSGQLDYLWYELENGYSSVLSDLKSVPNTENGAKKAADIFVRRFEVPSNVDAKSKERQAQALTYFKQITSILSGGTLPSAVDYNNLSAARKKILAAAQKMVDLKVPYVWGGSDPYGERGSGTDCSGLTQACYKAAGISISRSSSTQPGDAPHIIAVSQAVPGDILWRSGHVGIFIGDGQTIEQYDFGKTASYRTTKQFSKALHWDI